MFKISRKRLTQDEVRTLLFSLDAAFVERLAETVDIEDYCCKLSDNALFEIAENDGGIAGVVAFYETPSAIYITYVCVNVAQRQKGVAYQLMDSICRYVDCQQKSVSLEVRVSNERAIKIYEKAGFVVKSMNREKFFMTRKPVSNG